MIAVVDYDTGNLRSVCNALKRLGADYNVTGAGEDILKADHVIMPGVGEAFSAMEKLRQRGLDKVIPSLEQPVLGICIGMQLMCRRSEEGSAECLVIFDTEVSLLKPDKADGIKVPHTGWNRVTDLESPLFEGVEEGRFFYFVHSYSASLCPQTIARCENGVVFSAALRKDNFFGVQFHPEKSGEAGSEVLNNFLNL